MSPASGKENAPSGRTSTCWVSSGSRHTDTCSTSLGCTSYRTIAPVSDCAAGCAASAVAQHNHAYPIARVSARAWSLMRIPPFSLRVPLHRPPPQNRSNICAKDATPAAPPPATGIDIAPPSGASRHARAWFCDREVGLINNRPIGSWMLPAHVAASRSMLATLQRDFARLRTLEHPHIERLVELGCNGQQYYVAGERLDGEPLREVLNHLLPERLDVGEADDIVRAVGSALVYAHEQGVTHGAVRAENVLITMDRRILLTNFLARRVAKANSRPPRPTDDLQGLARLAAELYVGSTAPGALRAAVHAGVPVKRVHAIRAVLEPAGRRTVGVADFL
ncbi:MAG: hypothetical protein EHM50_06815, partial [Lysobacterales bacterium]